VLFADEPRWAPPLRSYETWLFSRGHPYRRDGDVVRFLVRRGGAVVGRICAHSVAGDERGWFGAFETADEQSSVDALLDAAREWLTARGCTSMSGPATFTMADEAGVLVDGFDHPGGTGRPWHPPYYAERLTGAGLTRTERESPRWRLDAVAGGPKLAESGPQPPHAGRFGDARLALQGDDGVIAAVPDVTAVARATSLRVRPAFTEAAVVRAEGELARLVPALLGAAAKAGYHAVWSPWTPHDTPPDTVHTLFHQTWR
jgi:hypothetical protein